LLTRDGVELVNTIHIVRVRDKAGLVWLAVFADVDGSALDTVVMTAGLVDRAGLIGHIGAVHELKGTQSITTVAAIIVHGARDHNLGRDIDIWPLSITSDLDTIRQS
jgi:hypothetical protein